MSNNLGASRVNEGQADKETTINDGLGALDAALTEVTQIDASADAAVSADVLSKAAQFVITGATAAHTLTLAPVKRYARFSNASAAAVVLAVGSGKITLPPSKAMTVYMDGTANNIEAASNIVPAGGVKGQALIKASAADYDAAWTDLPTSTGGGSGGSGGGSGGGSTNGATYEMGALATVDPAYFPLSALASGVVLTSAIVAGQGTRFKFSAANPGDANGYNVALRNIKAGTPLDVRVRFSLYVHPSAVNYPSRGLFLSDGTKFMGFQTGKNGSDGFVAQVQRRGSRQNYDSNPYQASAAGVEWLRIYDDGTTRYFMSSPDGQDWDTLFREGNTNWFTPTQFGIGVTMEGGPGTSPTFTQYAFLTSYNDNQA